MIMRFNPLCPARKLKKSGGAGYTTPNVASFAIPNDGKITADVTLIGFDFKWFSSATPTKDEFLSGKITRFKDGTSSTFPLKIYEVVAEATGAYCVKSGSMLYVVSTVLDNELGTLPKTGMYYSTAAAIADTDAWGATFTLDFGETIHPIDQKFMPDDTIDLDALGIPVADLVMSGGGTVEYTDENIVMGYRAEVAKKPKYAKMSFGGAQFRCAVTTMIDQTINMFLIAYQQGFIVAKIHIREQNNRVVVVAEVG